MDILKIRNHWAVKTFFMLCVMTLSYFLAQTIIGAIALAVRSHPFVMENAESVRIALSFLTYIIMIAVVFIGDRLIYGKKQLLNAEILGLKQPPKLRDIGLAVAGMPLYLIITVTLTLIVSMLYAGFDQDQAQGVSELGGQEPGVAMLIAMFLLIAIFVPFVEELLCRGYLFGRMKSIGAPVWAVVLVVSALFGVAHGQLNVAIDTFAISIIMCGTRYITGSIWASVLMHVIKNAVAFILLFVVKIDPTDLQGVTGMIIGG